LITDAPVLALPALPAPLAFPALFSFYRLFLSFVALSFVAMNSFSRVVVGLLFAGAVAVVAFSVFSFGVATRSASRIEGEINVEYITNPVQLHRNSYGIVHVVAQSDAEAFFGIGYAHAQDRLWQMEFARRVGRGRLSELFGRRTLHYDIFLRHLGLREIAKRLEAHINPEARAALQSYANGVNAFIHEHRSGLPFEFDALGFAPDDWTVADCLLVARLMAWELNLGFWNDAAMGAIADKLGSERALELVADAQSEQAYTPDVPAVLDSVVPLRHQLRLQERESTKRNNEQNGEQNGARPTAPPTDTTRRTAPQDSAAQVGQVGQVGFNRSPRREHPLRQQTRLQAHLQAPWTQTQVITTSTETARTFAEILRLGGELRRFLHREGSAVGSNAWAVRAASLDSASNAVVDTRKGAVLAGDTHLTLSLPPRWYEAHLTSPTMNVVGFTIPGLPFVVAGRNDDIAWSITNVMLDDCDYFIEQIDSTNANRYIAPDGVSMPFRVVSDTLRLREASVLGGIKDTLIEIRHAGRSAVLSDVHIFRQPRQILSDSSAGAVAASGAYFQKYCLTFQWTGQEMSDEILAMYRLQKANDWERFQRAVEGFAVPALNIAFADRFNNVGMMLTGAVPVRVGFGGSAAGANDFSTSKSARTLAAKAVFPRRGWEQSEQWQTLLPNGTRLERPVYPPSAMPRLYNPPRNYVVSANNPTNSPTSRNGSGIGIGIAPPYFLSTLWESSSRAERIEDMIAEHDTHTAFESQVMQTDVVSPYAARMAELVSTVLTRASASANSNANSNTSPQAAFTPSAVEAQALARLRGWRGGMDKTSAAAAVFNVFLERYVRNTLHDELGETLYREYCFVTNAPTRKIAELTALAESTDDNARASAAWWFDDKTTPNGTDASGTDRGGTDGAGAETRDAIIIKSFRETVEYLRKRMGTDSVGAWNYGTLHALTLPHVLGEEPALRATVNLGPYPTGGAATTVNSGEWSFLEPFKPVIGASMRLVCDMSEQVVWMILPGGNGGQALTQNYSDQIQLWLGGGLVPVLVRREPDRTTFTKTLTLAPM
jgi:penicillin G amidase